MSVQSSAREPAWPSLPFDSWKETCETLHMWTQIAGKIRLALSAPINHWWQATLYVTSRGLTTSPIPYGGRTFQMDFDFIDHAMRIETSDGVGRELALEPRTVADFYAATMSALRELALPVKIWTTPAEVADPIPFEKDEKHRSYDREATGRLWRVLLQANRLFLEFRSRFIGKCSPVHLFWGGFDLAVTRFSGRPAPPHPSVPGMADFITREAYSHECSSAGFWPGNADSPEAIFYAYAYPAPNGFARARVRPGGYSERLGEFVLPYQSMRAAEDPDAALLEFLQTSYDAAADLGRWDRKALERGRSPAG
ncbi:MAG: DUF5996 family protein [Thermoanaerobaculia bacterium]